MEQETARLPSEPNQGADAPPSTEPARGVIESTMEDVTPRGCAARSTTASTTVATPMVGGFEDSTFQPSCRLSEREGQRGIVLWRWLRRGFSGNGPLRVRGLCWSRHATNGTAVCGLGLCFNVGKSESNTGKLSVAFACVSTWGNSESVVSLACKLEGFVPEIQI